MTDRFPLPARPARATPLALVAALSLASCGGSDGTAPAPGQGPAGAGTGGGASASVTTAAWPTSAQTDPLVQGREPSLPSHVCATVSATLRKNARGLLDDAVDASTASSQPDAARLQSALSACTAGQAVKLVAGGAGENAFLTGPLTLPPTVSLWIDSGVTLFASRSPADYQVAGKNKCGEAAASDNGCSALITTSPDGNGVFGDGVIDGRGGAVLTSGSYAGKLTWWDVGALTKTMSGVSQNSPRLVQANSGSNFTLYRITLQNAPKFHAVTSGVNGVTVWGTRILTPSLEYSVAGYGCAAGTTPVVSGAPNTTTPSTCFTPATVKNTDGFDPGQSQNVLVAFNYINNGDDGVAIKSHSSTTGPVTGVQILHNRFYFTHGMSIGSETDSGIDGVTIHDLAIDGFDMGATSGVRIKTDDSRGGEVQHVTVDGVCARRLAQPIVIDPYYGDASGSSNRLYPNIHDITIRNFHYLDVPGANDNGANATLLLRGYQSQGQFDYLYGITLDNVVFDSTPGWAATSLAQSVPSFAQLTMGPGPVSFAALLGNAAGAQGVSVLDVRTGSTPAYDCSAAFVAFPAANAPMSVQ